MAERPSSSYLAQEWSVHAQLTISHRRPDVDVTSPTPQPDDDDGVHTMEYSWNPRPCYGFQRGNILFTTRPASVYGGGSLPSARRPSQPYGRRCKSTCSITLSTEHEAGGVTVSRSNSLNEPVLCEVCGGDRSPSSLRRAANYTTHFCTRVPDKTAETPTRQRQDAASQTPLDASQTPRDACQTPRDASQTPRDACQTPRDADAAPKASTSSKPVQPRMGNKLYAKRKSVTDLLHIIPPSPPPPPDLAETSPANKPRAAGKPPRTVHIDVYCTGSDASESTSSSSSSSSSGPQTVFESDAVRVVHSRPGLDRLPRALQQAQARGYDSEDGLSSQLSSCTTFQDSSSSCATSWKDTDDLDSLLLSCPSLAQSDSFDYADSVDRLRIRQRERAWEESKTWRSPQTERRRRKLREFLEKEGEDSDDDDDDDDETGDAWSFGGGSSSRVTTLKREDTVRKATPTELRKATPTDLREDTAREATPTDLREATPTEDTVRKATPTYLREDTARKATPTDLRKATPTDLTARPPPPPSKVVSSMTSPFTPHAGLRTDQLSRAERFGTIVGAFRKPGHHVGPSKNPECSCSHCRSFYTDEGRARTRSLDMSLEAAGNWKTRLREQIADRKQWPSQWEEQWDDSAAV